MNNFRWPAIGIVMFLMVITLSTSIYTFFDDAYGFENSAAQFSNVTGVNETIGEQLKIIAHEALDGINATESGMKSILSGLTTLQPNPTQNLFDIIGGLQNVAIGSLKSALVFFTAPLQVMSIILEFYVGVPQVVTYFGTILLIFVTFILVSLYLRSDI